jgi:hypothetical protein
MLHRTTLNTAERHALLLYALGLHRDGVRTNEIEAALHERGAPMTEAEKIGAEAQVQFERETVAAVELPATARLPINLYFALGVTPRASTQRIHSAYRRRAREVHPDSHIEDIDPATWNRLMNVVTDADTVLSDASKRRAYDIQWLQRSRRVTLAQATPRERRGDWETRYQWYMAEVAEIEEQLISALGSLTAAGVQVAPGDVEAVLDQYEDRVLTIRNQTYGVPETHQALPRKVRGELQRKDTVILALRQAVEAGLSGGVSSGVSEAAERLQATSAAHRRFEIQQLAASLPT